MKRSAKPIRILGFPGVERLCHNRRLPFFMFAGVPQYVFVLIVLFATYTVVRYEAKFEIKCQV